MVAGSVPFQDLKRLWGGKWHAHQRVKLSERWNTCRWPPSLFPKRTVSATKYPQARGNPPRSPLPVELLSSTDTCPKRSPSVPTQLPFVLALVRGEASIGRAPAFGPGRRSSESVMNGHSAPRGTFNIQPVTIREGKFMSTTQTITPACHLCHVIHLTQDSRNRLRGYGDVITVINHSSCC